MSVSAVLNPDPQKFPAGTTVKAYKKSDQHVLGIPTGAPEGTQDASATVATDGTVTFTGLVAQTDYLLYAATPNRYSSFSTRVATEASDVYTGTHDFSGATVTLPSGIVIPAGSVDAAAIAASLKPSGSAAAGTEALRALGTSASTAAAGNDSRLSDTRTPTDATVSPAKLTEATLDALDDTLALPGFFAMPPIPGLTSASVTQVDLRLVAVLFRAPRTKTYTKLYTWSAGASGADDPSNAFVIDTAGALVGTASGAVTGKLNTAANTQNSYTISAPLTAGNLYYACVAIDLTGAAGTWRGLTTISGASQWLTPFGSGLGSTLSFSQSSAYPPSFPIAITSAQSTFPIILIGE